MEDKKRKKLIIAAIAVWTLVLIFAIILIARGCSSSQGGEEETSTTDFISETTERATEPATTEKSTEPENGYILKYSADNSWMDGEISMYGLELVVTNKTSERIENWKMELVVEGFRNVTGWNCAFENSGDTLYLTGNNHNENLEPGASIKIGCNLGIQKEKLVIRDAKINGKPMVIIPGNVINPMQDTKQQDTKQQDTKQQDTKQQDTKETQRQTPPKSGPTKEFETETKGAKLSDSKPNTKGATGDDWLHTDGKKILDKNGKEVWLTGVNWFGYNTGTNLFDGLWNSKLEPTVEAIADHGFNLIRVPMSAELLNQWSRGEYPKANYNNAYNEKLNSMNSLEIWDYFLELAEQNGLKVMPDIHSAETNASGHNVNLWYTDKVKIEDFYHALEWLAERYADNDTIIAIDIKNEPHGKPSEADNAAIWNNSTKNNNWKYVAETAASKILARNPNVLIMVEGTEIYPKDLATNSDYHSTDEKDYDFNWWGGNLRAVRDYPVNLGKYQNKLVYSPHDYGPTVFNQPWFDKDYNYDSLMKDCWKDNWFYIYEQNIAPLLIGEWGGFMTEPNITWMTYMRQLIKKYRLNHTFWCLNANSGDTGGLLKDDFVTWDDEKYNFVKEVLWQENGKFVGLDHKIPLGKNGISL